MSRAHPPTPTTSTPTDESRPTAAVRLAQLTFDPHNRRDCPRMFADRWAAAD